MTGLVAGVAVKSVLGGAGAVLKGIPAQVWYGIAIIAAIAGGYFYHQHRLHQHDAALVQATITARDAAWQKRLDAEHSAALTWEAKAEERGQIITIDERKLNDQAIAGNDAVAHNLSVRGPGKAAAVGCGQGDHPGISTVADRPGNGASNSNAAGPQVPQPDGQSVSAIVEWDWLVDRAKEHDDLLSEVQTWRDWYKKESAVWAQEKGK